MHPRDSARKDSPLFTIAKCMVRYWQKRSVNNNDTYLYVVVVYGLSLLAESRECTLIQIHINLLINISLIIVKIAK